MKYKALIVERDSETIDSIVDILDSLGHKFDTAFSQSDAMKHILAGEYSYILLDLEIPARTQTGRPRIQNTENFLERLCHEKNGDCPPVVIMSACAAVNTDHTVEMMRLAKSLHTKGATDFVSKPFPTAGRTLDRVIKKVLSISRSQHVNTGIAKKIREKIKEESCLNENVTSSDLKCSNAWPNVPNEPITLDNFMAKFCRQEKGTYIVGRRKALLAAVRNESVKLPMYVKPWTRGQAKKYPVHDLLNAWPSYVERSLVTSLLPQYQQV